MDIGVKITYMCMFLQLFLVVNAGDITEPINVGDITKLDNAGDITELDNAGDITELDNAGDITKLLNQYSTLQLSTQGPASHFLWHVRIYVSC